MPFREINPVLFMQAQISRLYCKRHNMSTDDFLKLDRQTDILGFIETGYEPFHLMGEEGILDEIDDYCQIQIKSENLS
jgi:hypothetical protein